MTIAVLGAAGIVGRVISRTLASETRNDLRVGDVREDAVRALGKEIGAEAVLSRLPPAKGREVWITEVVLEGRRSGTPRTVVLRVTGDETRNGTAIAAVVGARLVAKGRIREPGVHPPERVIPAREFLEGLRAHGLKVSEATRVGGRR